MKNAPHLMATINAIEGKKPALNWLKRNNFHLLVRLAKASDNDKDQMKWLIKNDPLFAAIAARIKLVKDEIEEANNDVHRWGYE